MFKIDIGDDVITNSIRTLLGDSRDSIERGMRKNYCIVTGYYLIELCLHKLQFVPN